MKVMIEIPDNVCAMFVNCLYEEDGLFKMGAIGYDEQDIQEMCVHDDV